MFSVKVTAEAKEVIKRALERFDMPRPGIMISRQGVRADVQRTADGNAEWSVERLHSWTYTVSSMSALPEEDVVLVEGIPFGLHLFHARRSGELRSVFATASCMLTHYRPNHAVNADPLQRRNSPLSRSRYLSR